MLNIENEKANEILIDMAFSNSSEDTSKDSSDEDEVLEYMPDGEIVRKASKGFTQLSNCKRFWKAAHLT